MSCPLFSTLVPSTASLNRSEKKHFQPWTFGLQLQIFPICRRTKLTVWGPRMSRRLSSMKMFEGKKKNLIWNSVSHCGKERNTSLLRNSPHFTEGELPEYQENYDCLCAFHAWSLGSWFWAFSQPASRWVTWQSEVFGLEFRWRTCWTQQNYTPTKFWTISKTTCRMEGSCYILKQHRFHQRHLCHSIKPTGPLSCEKEEKMWTCAKLRRIP